MSFDAGHSHLPTTSFVTGCPLCDAAKAARDQALAHFAEALLLLSQVPPADPSEESTNTIRVNLAPIGLTGDDTGNCYSIDLTAKQAESLADAVDSMNAYLGSEQPVPFLPADEPTVREQVGSGEWSAAAVAQNDPDLYAQVTRLFKQVDPTVITKQVLDDMHADNLTVNRALDSWFGDITDPALAELYGDEDGDL